MKKFLSLFLLLLLKVNAQSDIRCSQLSGNIYQLEWHGVHGRSYFIQASTDDLATWDFLPDIRFGQGQTLRMAFEKVSEEMYLRLVYTDVSTTNPDTDDFDGDGWTNLEEVLTYNTSPFVFDTEGPGPNPNPNPAPGQNMGQGGGGAALAQFELEITVIQDGASELPVRMRLDAGFNIVSDQFGNPVGGGVPSISAFRGNKTTTKIKLTDITGQNVGAIFNLLQLQTDPVPPPSTLPSEVSMINGLPLVIPPFIPFVEVSITGDMDPDAAGSLDYWVFQPMDITTIFGIGTDFDSQAFFIQQLQNRLDAQLAGANPPYDVFNSGNIWGVKGVALREEGEEQSDAEELPEKIYAIEIMEAPDPLNRGLQSSERVVIFDGHSNFGFGPNFEINVIKVIDDFLNYGVGFTDIPTSFHGIPGEMIMQNPDGSFPTTGPGDEGDQASTRVALEGWAYLLLEAAVPPEVVSPEIQENVINYVPLENFVHPDNVTPAPDVGIRFPNSGAGNGGVLNRQGVNPNFFHYAGRLIVAAPGNEIPQHLGYRTFFYNACDTGRDYIENFQHREFVYTTQACNVTQATWVFVEQILDGRGGQFIRNHMNNVNGLGGADNNIDYYGFYNFGN